MQNIDFDNYQERLSKDGLTTLKILDHYTFNELLDIYSNLIKPNLKQNQMYWSLSDTNKGFSNNINKIVTPILSEYLKSVLDDVIPIISSFMIKPAKTASVNFHQDWTFVDNEPFNNSYTCWIPLVETTLQNGAMGFIPNTQNEYTFYRASPSPPFKHNFPQSNEFFVQSKFYTLKAGEPVVFNHRMVHGSLPNNTNIDRPAVAISFRNNMSNLIHVTVKPNSNLRILNKYSIDEKFFDCVSNEIITDYYHKGLDIPGYKIIEEIPFHQ